MKPLILAIIVLIASAFLLGFFIGSPEPLDNYTTTSFCPDGRTKTATAWSKEEGEKMVEFECGEIIKLENRE